MKKTIEILQGEHIFIAGRTGSGKTELAKIYSAGFPNVIVLDTKGTFNWKPFINDAPVYTSLKELIENVGIGKAVYRPNIFESNSTFYDNFFKWIYYRQNTVVMIDEVMSICTNASSIPFWYQSCLTRGRELNITVISCTQRPKTIPLVIMSESSHFFIFDLNIEADRKRVGEVIGYKDYDKLPSKINGVHSFYYFNFLMDEPAISKLKIRTVKRRVQDGS